MRDAQGRFVRKHAYRLNYDDGTFEEVRAHTPSDAVKARTRVLMPHTMTDLTAFQLWSRRRLNAPKYEPPVIDDDTPRTWGK